MTYTFFKLLDTFDLLTPFIPLITHQAKLESARPGLACHVSSQIRLYAHHPNYPLLESGQNEQRSPDERA